MKLTGQLATWHQTSQYQRICVSNTRGLTVRLKIVKIEFASGDIIMALSDAITYCGVCYWLSPCLETGVLRRRPIEWIKIYDPLPVASSFHQFWQIPYMIQDCWMLAQLVPQASWWRASTSMLWSLHCKLMPLILRGLTEFGIDVIGSMGESWRNHIIWPPMYLFLPYISS